MCAVAQPVSVSTPRRRAPSLNTYWAGSRASCGTGKGCTSIAPMHTHAYPSMRCSSTPSSKAPTAPQRPGGRPDRQRELAREPRDAAEVVVVLVGDQDGGNLLGLHPQAGEAAHGLAQAESAVQQQARVLHLDEKRVALTAAAEEGETHQAISSLRAQAGYLKSSCTSGLSQVFVHKRAI